MIRASKAKINPYGLRIVKCKDNTGYVCRKFSRTGRENTIHNQYLNDKLTDKQKAIKKGIKIGISIIDAERDSNSNIVNTEDTEARIIMCCIDEQLRKIGE